jgi:DNA polymerase-3 subunit gamma/tau
MLQIVDHALGRMRSSGHARVLAEMAVVRLAALEDLDDLSAAVERLAAAGPAAASAPASAHVAAPAAPAAPPTAAPPRRDHANTPTSAL